MTDMITISAKDITKEYGEDVILKDVSFHVDAGDRVGIIGTNGAGKTTLMNILSGELEADEGNFFIAENTSLGYLKQQSDVQGDETVIEHASAQAPQSIHFSASIT